MGSLIANNARFRYSYAKIPKVLEIQNLIEIQKKSYEDFLQNNRAPDERKDQGLQAVFNSVFPIQDFNQTASLQFVSYTFDKPKYEVDECRERGMTYAAPLKVTVRLVVWDVDDDDESQNIRDIKEQEVYFGDLPIMTENGTFIVNGTERVVVSQLHRSPGIFFDQDRGKTSFSGKVIFSARIIPNRGSWLDFEFDAKDILHVRIDRRRKLPATVLLRALGFEEEQLLDYFYDHEQVQIGEPEPIPGTEANIALQQSYEVLRTEAEQAEVTAEEAGKRAAEAEKVAKKATARRAKLESSAGRRWCRTVHQNARATALVQQTKGIEGPMSLLAAAAALHGEGELTGEGIGAVIEDLWLAARDGAEASEIEARLQAVAEAAFPRRKSVDLARVGSVEDMKKLANAVSKALGITVEVADAPVDTATEGLEEELRQRLAEKLEAGCAVLVRGHAFSDVAEREGEPSPRQRVVALNRRLRQLAAEHPEAARFIVDEERWLVLLPPRGGKLGDKIEVFDPIERSMAFNVKMPPDDMPADLVELLGDDAALGTLRGKICPRISYRKDGHFGTMTSDYLARFWSVGDPPTRRMLVLEPSIAALDPQLMEAREDEDRILADLNAAENEQGAALERQRRATDEADAIQEKLEEGGGTYTRPTGLWKVFQPELHKGTRTSVDIVHPETGDLLIKAEKKLGRGHIRKLERAGIKRLPLAVDDVVGMVVAHDIVDLNTGEIIAECNEEITEQILQTIRDRGIDQITTLFIDRVNVGSFLRDTLLIDKVANSEDAIIEIYRRLRPGDPPTYETALAFFENLFFNSERYDLGRVGRLKMNHKLALDVALEQTTLTREDIMQTVRYLIELRNGRGSVDDIDHLGNRRVRAVGELLENQFRIGLVRMEKAIKERMSLSEIETLMPHDLINAKPVSAVVKEFFGSSQLSQFMDQTNPLSEITHKRRLSALGPGGLTRERAGFDVRDVHPTHYGRICPIETPEGPNIGLIASLSTYARVNEYGFIETPYRMVEQETVTNDVRYFSALEEEGNVIAQASAPQDEKGRFVNARVAARTAGEPSLVPASDVTLMDISPNQLVSVAASLIPFLEHDDANRALMGSNMQRQAVPLVKTQAPFVGTGFERFVARDSGVTTLARRPGTVEYVDATRIVIRTEETQEELGGEVDIYHLVKYRRSNQNTCINQKPVVRVGDVVDAGVVIADGPATDTGELALGQNAVVAFMPWGGFNFEDSILISERLVREDVFTSIHIEEFEVASRDTKLGKEEITCDIPNVGEEALKDLDESGIVRIGAEVKSGDVLVGKITPKGETQLSPEEKLLRAIFGEKAGDVRDTSLRVPPGVQGTVIHAQIFSREGVERDERARQIQEEQIARMLKDKNDEMKTIFASARAKLWGTLRGHDSGARIVDDNTGEVIFDKGEPFTEDGVFGLPVHRWSEIVVKGSEAVENEVLSILDSVNEQTDLVDEVFESKIAGLKRGDELPPGVIKLVKVYIAIKRKLSVGDKMAGRHGNKGVISKILSDEDMPYLADGTPVDIVLNPLGVPSRMNVGQILETHLGWAALGLRNRFRQMSEDGATADAIRSLALEAFRGNEDMEAFCRGASDDEIVALAGKLGEGVFLATPVFEGASEAEIKEALERAGLTDTGQVTLFDGRSGDAFDTKVTVGVMYMLKLHHLVDDKIHARSIGPYSLVTQQPLGGKAQFGGQRLGEMEVWAMEAYGAAHALQEFLTVKSDDVAGRTRMYESIVKGENTLEAGLPESFNVLVKELQSLALNMQLIEDRDVRDRSKMDLA